MVIIRWQLLNFDANSLLLVDTIVEVVLQGLST